MKAKKYVKRIDRLGRVVIPQKIKQQVGIKNGAPLAISCQGETICMIKQEPACCFCGNTSNLFQFHNKLVCCECRIEMKQLRRLKR